LLSISEEIAENVVYISKIKDKCIGNHSIAFVSKFCTMVIIYNNEKLIEVCHKYLFVDSFVDDKKGRV